MSGTYNTVRSCKSSHTINPPLAVDFWWCGLNMDCEFVRACLKGDKRASALMVVWSTLTLMSHNIAFDFVWWLYLLCYVIVFVFCVKYYVIGRREIRVNLGGWRASYLLWREIWCVVGSLTP